MHTPPSARKTLLPILLGLVYLAALAFSLLLFLKPGAAFFYHKEQIHIEELSRVEDAFQYSLHLNTWLYDPATILLLEDEEALQPTPATSLSAANNGYFSWVDLGDGQINLSFVSSDPSTRHDYFVCVRPYLLTRTFGGILFILLSLGLLALLVVSAKRRMRLPFTLWVELCDRLRVKVLSFWRTRADLIRAALVNLVLSAFFYVLMEWVFYITKPSFMDILSFGEKLRVFLLSGLAVAALSVLVLPVLILLDALTAPLFPKIHKYLYPLPCAFIITCLCLILVDNFTYTIFQVGIASSSLPARILYGLGFAVVFLHFLRKMAQEGSRFLQRAKTVMALLLLCVSLALAGFTFKPQSQALNNPEQEVAATRPNILFMGTDGLTADHMSVYGYERETTPYLREWAPSALFSQNNFTNASNSTGSDTALLTGKSPFATRVLYPPDTLKGSDMYQHLPGLLKRNGYRTVSLGADYYVDANIINFQYAFDDVNCVANPVNFLSSTLTSYGFADEIFFLNTVEKRIGDRLAHIFFIKEMQNPYTQVTQNTGNGITDQQRKDCLQSYLEQAQKTGQPLFAHIHLMGTHGPKFEPSAQVFSKGQKQNQDWMPNFYDDAILDFDAEVRWLVEYLQTSGMYNNTILVIYTDHAQEWTAVNRIPLLIHFPDDQYAGKLSSNTQNIDLAPTILDYLGIAKPTWMEGQTLLSALPSNRLIFIGGTNKGERIAPGLWALSEKALQPPFYQFTYLTAVQCQNWFTFNLDTHTVSSGQVSNYVNACPQSQVDALDAIREKAGQFLTRLGYHLPDTW